MGAGQLLRHDDRGPGLRLGRLPDPDLGEHVRWLHDPDRTVAAAFGAGYPTAVLVGADGVTAGGPVSGGEEVLAFLQDLHDELVDSGVDPRSGEFDPSVLEPAG